VKWLLRLLLIVLWLPGQLQLRLRLHRARETTLRRGCAAYGVLDVTRR